MFVSDQGNRNRKLRQIRFSPEDKIIENLIKVPALENRTGSE